MAPVLVGYPVLPLSALVSNLCIYSGQQLIAPIEKAGHTILIKSPACQHGKVKNLGNQQLNVLGFLFCIQIQDVLHNRA